LILNSNRFIFQKNRYLTM